jgi:hypothetical protein
VVLKRSTSCCRERRWSTSSQSFPFWESCRCCGQATQGPFSSSTEQRCSPARIVSIHSLLGQTAGLELEMDALRTCQWLGARLVAGHVKQSFGPGCVGAGAAGPGSYQRSHGRPATAAGGAARAAAARVGVGWGEGLDGWGATCPAGTASALSAAKLPTCAKRLSGDCRLGIPKMWSHFCSFSFCLVIFVFSWFPLSLQH